MADNLEEMVRKGAAIRKGAASGGSRPVESAQGSLVSNTGLVGGSNGYEGADSSNQRGFVYFPELDTKKEINPVNRRELLKRARWMYANLGIVRRAVNGVARMVVGTGLTPEPQTDDREWNELAKVAFERRTRQAATFDLAEKYNFGASQRALVRNRLKDGDMGVILTESRTARARVAFAESHRIGTGRFLQTTSPEELRRWWDGVKVDKNNAARMYRVLGDKPENNVDIPARDFIHYVDYERAGQRRGVTALAHAVNNLLDVNEIQSFVKQGVKISNRVGYYLADKGEPRSSSGIGGAISGAVSQMKDSQGNEIQLEDVYGEGGEIPNVPPGKELRLLADQRPHPNTLGFLDFLIRDIAWGIGIGPELLWNISTLGGANTRFILADAQGWIEEQQQMLVDQYLQRIWAYTIAKEIKAGELRAPFDPDWMLKMGWITPPRVTVDFGRDGKLHMEQMRSGMLTFKQFYGWKGQTWKPQVEQWIDERAHMRQYAAEQHGLSMAEIMETLPKKPEIEDDDTREEDEGGGGQGR